MVYWNFFVAGVALLLSQLSAAAAMSSRQAASIHTLQALHALIPYECIAFVCKHKHDTQHTHVQTNTFAQQAEKKLKHQYQLKNMNKEQELVLGIENLVCFTILWAMRLGGMEYGECLPHLVFTWKCAVLVATDGTQYTSNVVIGVVAVVHINFL